MIAFPNAKVNIGLRVLLKRADGFHDLESILVPIPLNDVLEVVQTEGNGQITFDFLGNQIPGHVEDNLCFKAYQLLNDDFRLPAVNCALLKQIPTGGGLAGGSSNGTFMLKALNDLFELQLTDEQLENYALQLGSDCPYFVKNQPALITGRGEHVQPIDLDLTGLYMAVVTPGIHVSTAEAFGGIAPNDAPSGLSGLSRNNLAGWQELAVNDFEQSVFKIHPVLAEIKQQLLDAGAYYASMSGTGSTVFGLFENRPVLDLENGQVLSL